MALDKTIAGAKKNSRRWDELNKESAILQFGSKYSVSKLKALLAADSYLPMSLTLPRKIVFQG